MVDWRHFPEDLGTFDLVFASDVLYEKEYAELLPVLLLRLLASGGNRADRRSGTRRRADIRRGVRHARARDPEKETRPFEAGEIKQKIDIYEIGERLRTGSRT